MTDAYDLLEAESATFGGRMLPLNLTPYIMGLPYRIDAFERLLAELAARPGAPVRARRRDRRCGEGRYLRLDRPPGLVPVHWPAKKQHRAGFGLPRAPDIHCLPVERVLDRQAADL